MGLGGRRVLPLESEGNIAISCVNDLSDDHLFFSCSDLDGFTEDGETMSPEETFDIDDIEVLSPGR